MSYCPDCGTKLKTNPEICPECSRQADLQGKSEQIQPIKKTSKPKLVHGLDAIVGLLIIIGSIYLLLALLKVQSLANVASGLATSSTSAPASGTAPVNVGFSIAEKIGIASLMFVLVGIFYGAKRFIENVVKIIRQW